MHMVFFESLRKIFCRKIPAVEIAPVMIAVGKPYAVSGFDLPQCMTGGQHICTCGIVIHKVSRYQNQIRILLHDFIQTGRKALSVKGSADVRVGKQCNTQRPNRLVACQPILRPPYMHTLVIPDYKINYNRQQCKPALPVNLCLFSRNFLYNPENKSICKEKEKQMQKNHDRVNHREETGKQ